MNKTIKEERTVLGNNESQVKRGVYQLDDGSFEWMTYTRCGYCKKVETALRKAGF